MFARLIFSSSSRASACANCALARSSCAARRLVARLGVVERLLGDAAALEEVLRAIEVGLGELEVGLALADRGLRRPRTTPRPASPARESRGPRLGEQLAPADAVAQPDVHRFEPPADLGHDLDRRRADQVADDRDALGDVGRAPSCAVSTVIGGRNPPPGRHRRARPPPGRCPAGRLPPPGGRAASRIGSRVRSRRPTADHDVPRFRE